jgi:hypothetical protein
VKWKAACLVHFCHFLWTLEGHACFINYNIDRLLFLFLYIMLEYIYIYMLYFLRETSEYILAMLTCLSLIIISQSPTKCIIIETKKISIEIITYMWTKNKGKCEVILTKLIYIYTKQIYSV